MKIENLTVKFDGLTVIDNQNFEFADGKITCIMGPSGCGKTTLLNAMAGLNSKPASANISYIFQEPRLLPWLNVRDNICAVLPQSTTKSEREAIADKMISEVELSDFASFYPAKLSGGMKQRVSLARAFGHKCDLMLMDEPFTGQDMRTKREMISLFLRLWSRQKMTVVAVVHDVSEAWFLADEVVVFSDRPAQEILRFPLTVYRPQRVGCEDCEQFQSLKKAVESAILNK